MRLAIYYSEAAMDRKMGGPFGAIITKGDRLVGIGYNRVTSSNDPTAHAEIDAIRDACGYLETYDLSGCVIFSSCEPCPMCLSAIYWARIEKIYYGADRDDAVDIGFDDAWIYSQVSTPVGERAIPMEQIEAESARKSIRKWATFSGKIPY